ncbi:MAG TPA: HD-GYP domain-containing protein [Bacillota bacterium]
MSLLRRVIRPATPYTLFTVSLGLFIMLGSLGLSAVLSVFLQRYFVGETVAITRRAVEVHFNAVFGTDVFSAAPFAPHAGAQEHYASMDYEYGVAPSGGSGGYGSSGDHTAHGGPANLEVYDTLVRLHFDLYDITDAWFIDPAGTVVFAYEAGDIGHAPPLGEEDLAAVLAGSTWSTRPSSEQLRLAFPVVQDGKVAGAVLVYRDISSLIAELQRIQLTLLAASLAVGALLFLSLRRVYLNSTHRIRRQSEALADALDEVERTYDTTLEAIAGVLDLRDRATRGHSVRVMLYTDLLARQLEIDDDERRHIVRGALLHDVGKMGIPDAILQKPGPLTPEEWQIMRQHPRLGFEMLSHIPFLKPALPVVLHHHERWDGRGYPAGLQGPMIPVGARIFSVADALDAMTSERPYRGPMSFDEAAREIIAESGRQFDPSVVEAFSRIPAHVWAEAARQAENAWTPTDLEAEPVAVTS